MAKFTDAVKATLKGYFNAGDQPTELQFAALMDAIQEGIEEHQHDSTGDGDGTGILNGPITMADGQWIGIGAALERIVFDAAGDISVMGAKFGIGTVTPNEMLHVHNPTGHSKMEVSSATDNANLILNAPADEVAYASWETAGAEDWSLLRGAGTTALEIVSAAGGVGTVMSFKRSDGTVTIPQLAGVGNRAIGVNAAGKLIVI